MQELKERGAQIFTNPYVIQVDKFAGSLKKLSDTFSKLEDYRATFTNEENDDIFERVTQKVCRECENREKCLGERRQQTYHMMREILCAVQDYGAELNVELKRRLMKQCLLAPRFLRETLENYENVRQKLIWNNKMVQNREGFAAQLNDLAKTLCYTTHELDAGIFEDEHLKKKIRNQLKKSGIKILSSVFYMTAQGKYEIHLTLKASKGHIVAMKELASEVGKMAGRIDGSREGRTPNYRGRVLHSCLRGRSKISHDPGCGQNRKRQRENFRRYIFDLGLAGRKKRCGTVRRYGFR